MSRPSPRPPSPPPPPEGTGRPLRVGLAGAGGVAARHAETLASFPDVTLAGVADPDTARAEALAAGHGMTAYADPRALVDAADLDALYVCVPPFAHGAPEEAALEAGLALFVEKPVALDLDFAAHVAAGIAERGLVSGTGYHWRYLPGAEEAARLLAGRPARLAVAAWHGAVPPVGWWLSAGLGGGQVAEQATHVLDLARLLVGEVVEVAAAGAAGGLSAHPDADIDDVTAGLLRFAGGAVGSVTTTCLLPGPYAASLTVFAEGLAVEVGEAALTVTDAAGRRVAGHDVAAAKTAADRAFVDAVRAGDPARVRAPYAEAARSAALGVALTRAARTRGPVPVAAVAP